MQTHAKHIMTYTNHILLCTMLTCLWLGVTAMPACATTANQPLTLLQQGQSKYQIIIDQNASPSETHAAEELRLHIQACTGVDLPISHDLPTQDAPAIIIGLGKATQQLGITQTPDDLPNQACIIKTIPPHIVIAGTKAAGTLQGAHRFLEDYLGVRWFTPDTTKTPQQNDVPIPAIDKTIQPSFAYRSTSYTWPGQNADFNARLGRNPGGGGPDSPYGEQYAFNSQCHSYFLYVNPNEFFDTHPEYFSQIGGKRVRQETQLCLTNPDVLDIVTERILDAMRKNPHLKQFNISQMDYYNFCECPKCREMNQRLGTNGGTQFWFVNQVAQRTSKVFPDKLIGTLAYTYTEDPPKNLKMHPNVAVWLCHMFPCCDSHPIATCPLNADYKRRALAWSKICSHLYIWHYIVDFAHYYNPFPNFRAMAADMKFYKSIGTEGIFLQGMGQAGGGGEFSLLRGYYGQKLLANVDQNPDALIQDFLKGYYGPAADPLWKYITLLHDKVENDNIHMHLYTNPAMGYLTDDIMAAAEALFDQAEQNVANDPTLLERVKVARLPLQYARLFPINGYEINENKLTFLGKVAGPDVAQDFIARLQKHGFRTIREHGGDPAQLLMFAQVFTNDVPIVTLQNDLLKVDIAPALGGRALRIIDKKTKKCVTAHNVTKCLYYPFAGGLGNWVGEIFSPCGFLEPGIVTASDDRSMSMVTKTMTGLTLTRYLRLDDNTPTLHVTNSLTNNTQAPMPARLRSHLELDIGSLGKTQIEFKNRDQKTVKPNIKDIIATMREGIHFYDQDTPDGSWSFSGDRGLTVHQQFNNDQVEFTWLYAYPDSLNQLETELWAPARQLQPQETVTLTQTITVSPNP